VESTSRFIGPSVSTPVFESTEAGSRAGANRRVHKPQEAAFNRKSMPQQHMSEEIQGSFQDVGSHVGFHGPPLVLASSSPDRQRLMREAGYSFRVMTPSDREHSVKTARLSPAEFVQAQAYMKARDVADRLEFGIVVGADSVTAVGNVILGKPHSAVEHRVMLEMLSGQEHEVVTGLAVIHVAADRRAIGYARTKLRMRTLSPLDIDTLVLSEAGRNSCGGYMIDESAGGTVDPFVTILNGSLSNVVGLPMDVLARLLAEVRTPSAKPVRCRV